MIQSLHASVISGSFFGNYLKSSERTKRIFIGSTISRRVGKLCRKLMRLNPIFNRSRSSKVLKFSFRVLDFIIINLLIFILNQNKLVCAQKACKRITSPPSGDTPAW